jgi:hypothetical protein
MLKLGWNVYLKSVYVTFTWLQQFLRVRTTYLMKTCVYVNLLKPSGNFTYY